MKVSSWRKRLVIGVGGVLLVLFIMGAFYIWPLIPTEVSGVYIFGVIEASYLFPVEYPGEGWWVEPQLKVAEQIEAMVPAEDPNDWYIRAFVRIRGRRTPWLPKHYGYGHFGQSERLVHITQIVEARAVTEEDRVMLGLEVGMTKVEVLEIRGEPYRRETQGENEWFLYQTNSRLTAHPTVKDSYVEKPESEWLTPLLFQNGKLMGWDQNYWTTKEQKFDVKIDQTVKQK